MDHSPVGRTTASAHVHASPSRTDDGIAIRPMVSLDELVACVALQNRVWGEGFSEAVPVSLLKAASYVGGLSIGAFAVDGTLVGFVFGLTGIAEGKTVHWSHLLGVLDTARNLGVGRMLKEYQRDELARRGIPELRWTFDPLIAKNAHLNLNLLGARVVRFTPNMYGTNDTPLHHGLPTDRFVVAWPTTTVVRATDTGRADVASAPVIALEPPSNSEMVALRSDRPPVIRLEIPRDFQQLASTAADRAAAVQASVREHLLWAFESGYSVDGLHRDPISSRTFYVLTSAPASV